MVDRRDRLPFALALSPFCLLPKSGHQRCECEGDERDLEGQLQRGELFYGEDGGGDPVGDTDHLHLLH